MIPSRLSLRTSQSDIDNFIHDKLRQSLADRLVRTRMQRTGLEHVTGFQADLFVFTPDEFYRCVQEEAMRINRQANIGAIRP